MTTIPKPRDVTEILRGVGSAEFPWKDPTLGTLLHRAADEIKRLRAAGDALAQSHERALAALGIDWDGRQQSLRAWQEARRG